MAAATAVDAGVAFGAAAGCGAGRAAGFAAGARAGGAGAVEVGVEPPPEACWTRWLVASDWAAAPRAFVMALPRPPGIELPGPCAGEVVVDLAGFAAVDDPASAFGRNASMYT